MLPAGLSTKVVETAQGSLPLIQKHSKVKKECTITRHKYPCHIFKNTQ